MNLDCPEGNREFVIYPVRDVLGVEKEGEPRLYYYGFFILILVDHCWYELDKGTEHYKARVFTSNQVLVTVPAWDYTLLYNRDELVQPAARFPGYAINAIDNACHDFDKNKTQRQSKHFLLQFPSDFELKSSVITEEATEDELLPLSLHTVETKNSDGTVTKRLYAGFTVARTDVSIDKRGKVETKPKESKGARLLDDLDNDSGNFMGDGSD